MLCTFLKAFRIFFESYSVVGNGYRLRGVTRKVSLTLRKTLQRCQSLAPISLLNADVDVTLPPGLIGCERVGGVGEGI